MTSNICNRSIRRNFPYIYNKIIESEYGIYKLEMGNKRFTNIISGFFGESFYLFCRISWINGIEKKGKREISSRGAWI